MVNWKRGVLVVGSAVAFVAAPLVVASPAQAECPWGTKQTRFEGVCISGAGGGSAPIIPVPPPAGGGAKIVNNPNGFDTVNGVPCTPDHYAVCYGMAQNG
ncbi:hypothetical protein [Mycobacterium sp. ITM-2016-00318]|uniref:hypothetical protein n=1 Tax=Mycobacterium sp. ITM-2016-00318 TaxID=2099693 RepID=UPI000CFA1537|nr:hypothetical protein [Mycobacterium sp. ITM-2016-00318]WNG90871.1 hypothetical protein C6A82_015100 [Mycobacterium sp. ITM-2016-00318]